MRWVMCSLALLACGPSPLATPPETPAVLPARSAAPAPPEPPPNWVEVASAKALVEGDMVGTLVSVDIVEPIRDSTTSSLPEPGEYDVEVTDVGPARFLLTFARTAEERRAGALAQLPAGLHAPLRVRGMVVAGRNEEVDWTVILVHELSQLAYPTPEPLESARQLIAQPARWARKYVEVEDDYLGGFEASFLGDGRGGKLVWLDAYPDADIRCRPQTPAGEAVETRVRVRGYAYTEKSYGHLGAAKALIVATHIVYLDAARPDCR